MGFKSGEGLKLGQFEKREIWAAREFKKRG